MGNQYSEHKDEGIVRIRNCYFRYDSDADTGTLYRSFKNHYLVSEGVFHYRIGMKETSPNHWLIDQDVHNSLLYLLRLCFGFDSFRSNQEEIICKCLNEQSVLGVLPTSAGKSLCYQMSALLLPGPTLVVSPLKSLMEDQYDNLCEYGIGNVAFITGDNSSVKQERVINNRSLMTLVSPERFFNVKFMEFLSSGTVKHR